MLKWRWLQHPATKEDVVGVEAAEDNVAAAEVVTTPPIKVHKGDKPNPVIEEPNTLTSHLERGQDAKCISGGGEEVIFVQNP